MVVGLGGFVVAHPLLNRTINTSEGTDARCTTREHDMDPAVVFRAREFGYRSPVASALPRFTGPAQARQRMRLIAALGMLAIAAITTGGLASLASKRPAAPAEREQPRPSANAVTPELPTLFDPARRVEAQVEEAERAAERARAMIRSERERGLVDDRLLDALEHRLDGIDDPTPTKQNGTRERVPFESQPRSL